MKKMKLLVLAIIASTLTIFGCSESGTGDAVDQSSDDLQLLDSESATDMLSANAGDADANNAADTASGQQNDNGSLNDSAQGNTGTNGNDTAQQNEPGGVGDGDTATASDTAPSEDSDSENNSGNPNSSAGDTDDTDASEGHGHGNGDTSGSEFADTASAAETGDTGGENADTATEPGDTTDSATTVDTAQSDVDTASDTADTAVCPFTCRSENWCNNNDGIVHDSYICDEVTATQVCCELADDSDSGSEGHDNGEVDSDTDITCTYGCHSKSWCTANDGVVYAELTCNGNQICCAIEE